MKSRLEGIPSVHIVHSFPRIEKTNQVARWKKFMTTTNRMDAWTILRTAAFTRYLTTCDVEVLHQVTVRGMLELNDEQASQDEFDATIDAIMLTLYPSVNLSGQATLQGPAQLAEEEIRIFADTVVHYAEITTVINQTVHVVGRN
jgi:hypothetical protein